jgi:HEAT repeat protein
MPNVRKECPLSRPKLAELLLVPAALLGLGCVTDGSKDKDRHAFTESSVQLQREIESHALAVRAGRNLEAFAREAEWFRTVGEPAYPTLLELAGDADVRVASFGLATISAQRDPRLLEPLKEAVPPPTAGPLRLEYARALALLGDWSQVDVLIDALTSEDVQVRGSALKVLRDTTGESFGFHPQGAPADRAAAVGRWRAWSLERAADPALRVSVREESTPAPE